jgi:hypothetical protein
MAVLSVALLGSVFAGSAQACSCVKATPSESLARADGAIVGRLLSVVPRGRLYADYRYRVERVYRGREAIERGQMLSVRSARSAAACALPARTDARYGLFLARGENRWFSGICGVISPRRLQVASRHMPRVYHRAGGAPFSCAG